MAKLPTYAYELGSEPFSVCRQTVAALACTLSTFYKLAKVGEINERFSTKWLNYL